MKIKKVTLGLSIAALSSYLIAAIIFFSSNFSYVEAKEFKINQEKNVEITGVENVNISSISTDIKIKTDDIDKIEVLFAGTLNTNTDDAKPKLIVEKKGDTVNIFIKRQKKTHFGFFNYSVTSDLKLTVVLPTTISGIVKIKSISGDIKFKDLKYNKIILKTVSGDMKFENLMSKDVTISSTSGDVSGEIIKGDNVEANSTSGDFNFTEIICKDFEFSTTSGNLEAKNIVTNDISISTVSGDISVNEVNAEKFSGSSVTGDLNFRKLFCKNIDGSAVSADISLGKCKGDISFSSVSGDITGEVLSFSKTIKLSTTSGDISLNLPEDVRFSFKAYSRGDIEYNTGGKSINSERKLILPCDDCSKHVSLSSTSGEIIIK